MGKVVYLVWTGEYSDKNVAAVCSTKEAAEAVVRMLERQGSDDPRIDEMILDEFSSPAMRGLLYYVVTFDAGGASQRGHLSSSLSGAKVGRVLEFRDGTMSVSVMARDEAHAIKIASEKRTIYLAQKHGLA